MKVILIHNFYDSLKPSGENNVFEAEGELLKSFGNKVSLLSRCNDEIISMGIIGKIKGALITPWNPWTLITIRKKKAEIKPDVIHVHNTFPLISPSVFFDSDQSTICVLTLHNYRIFCPAGIPLRKRKVCILCLEKHSAWYSVKYGCYRNSRLATLPLAIGVELHRRIKTWEKYVDAFIALSEFQKDLMISAGLPANKVYVKSNFYSGNPVPVQWNKRGNYMVFVGRLGQEKGVETLVNAWKQWEKEKPELRIVGDGPLADKLKLASFGLPIKFLGQLSSAKAQEQIANAKLLILPSEWFEGFPMVIAEAFAFGTPTAVSDIGPLPSIVQHGKNGIVFKPADPESLIREVKYVWENPALLEKLGTGARESFEKHYTKEANYKRLMEIYQMAIETKRNNAARK